MEDKDEYLFGIRAVAEALEAGKEPGKVWMAKDLNSPQAKELTTMLRKRGVPIQYVPVEKLNTLAWGRNHQGVVCQLSQVEFVRINDVLPDIIERGDNPLLVVLDRVTDVRNFGAITRTASCAGAQAVVVPTQKAAAANADAIKASAGAMLQMPICREDQFKKALYTILDGGVQLVGVTEKATTSLYDLDLTGPTALLFGSEDDGITPEFLRLCTAQGSLPMFGPIGSLNVGAAAAAALFETVRQRGLANADAFAPHTEQASLNGNSAEEE